MIRLRVLGSLELLAADGREIRSVLAQPKRFAVLAYLAAQPERFVRRDALLPVFWPELDQTHARWALNQALRFLRKALGDTADGALVGRHADEVGIDPSMLSSDLVDFREHLRAGRHAEALALYRGELLAGFHADAGPEFEEWLQRERRQVRAAAADAARSVALAREREGAFPEALAAARQAVELVPEDERTLRELLRLLDRTGDRATSIRTYDEFAQRLLSEYDSAPSAETQRLIERIRQSTAAAHPPLVSAVPAPHDVAPTERAIPSPAWRVRSRWLVGGALVGVATAIALGAVRTREPEDAQPVRFVFNADSGLAFADVPGALAIAPDGRQIAFAASAGDGTRHLYVRSTGELHSRMIPETERAEQLFFSPDGEWIGFYAPPLLKKVRLRGGPIEVIGEVPRMYGAHWSRRGEIVVSSSGRLAVIPSRGGSLRALYAPDTAAGELQQLWPIVLDDGTTIVYTARGRYVEESRLAVASISGAPARILDLKGTGALGVIDGLLVYGRGTRPSQRHELLAVPFDAERGEARGEARVVVSGVSVNWWGRAAASVSRNGSLVYRFTEDARRRVVVTRRGGERLTLPGEPRAYHDPRFSPDGQKLAVSVEGEGLYVFDLPSGNVTRVTQLAAARMRYPEWTPDGKRLVFLRCATDDGGCDFWSVPVDMSAPESFYLRSARGAIELAELMFSRDGRRLVTRVNLAASGRRDIWHGARAEDGPLVPLVEQPGDQFGPRISPNGDWVAYYTNSAPSQVYVTAFPGPGPTIKISVDAGENPIWSPDGRTLFYMNGTNGNRILAARLRLSPELTVLSRDTMFVGGFDDRPDVHGIFDVAADGQRFALLERVDREPQVIVVQDWRFELRSEGRLASGR